MKLLTTGILAAALALGGLAFLSSNADAATIPDFEKERMQEAESQPSECETTECPITGCEATVERLSDDTCRIECTGPEGESCWVIVQCEEDSCTVLERGGDDCETSECEVAPKRPCATDC